MIIHASLKTDVSYFYTQWLINRLKEGYFDIPATKPGEINRYDLKNNNIEKIYLHTRNPIKIIKNSQSFKILKYEYEVVTHISLYDKFYEPKIIDKYKIFDYVRKCETLFGKKNNSLCYGPIFKTINNDLEWHIAQFRFLCKILSKSIGTIYYNFNFNTICKNSTYFSAEELTQEEKKYLIIEFKKITDKYGLNLKKMQTEEEFKYDEIDIGEKDACPATCKHCPYISNGKTSIIKSNMHNPDSSLLIGNPNRSENITKIDFKSQKEEVNKLENTQEIKQFSLFDIM